MAEAQTSEPGVTLAPLNTEYWNNIRWQIYEKYAR